MKLKSAKDIVQQFLKQNPNLIENILQQKVKKQSKIIGTAQKKDMKKMIQGIQQIKLVNDKIKNILSIIGIQYKKLSIPQDKTDKQKKNQILSFLKNQKNNIQKILKFTKQLQDCSNVILNQIQTKIDKIIEI